MYLKIFRKCGATLLFLHLILAFSFITGCIELGSQSISASSAGVPELQSGEWSGQLRMDIDPELRSDLFSLRGDVILAGNGTLPYLMLNATLHQGKASVVSTKYLLLKLGPNRDYSFEIAKNINLLPGEYICTLEASGPGGTLASESRRCSLVMEQEDLISSGILLSPSEARALYAGRSLYGYQSIEEEGQRESPSGEEEREEKEGAGKEDESEGGREDAKDIQSSFSFSPGREEQQPSGEEEELEDAGESDDSISAKAEGSWTDENEGDDSIPGDSSAPGDSDKDMEAGDPASFDLDASADDERSESDGSEALAGGAGEDGNESDEADLGRDGGYSEHSASLMTTQEEPEAGFVGSSTSKKYHLPDCRYAQKIKPENRIYFQSENEAKGQGYTPCKSCHP